jgi:hypothetical protein
MRPVAWCLLIALFSSAFGQEPRDLSKEMGQDIEHPIALLLKAMVSCGEAEILCYSRAD